MRGVTRESRARPADQSADGRSRPAVRFGDEASPRGAGRAQAALRLRALLRLSRKEIVVMVRVEERAVLITGANRGIGRALVEEALRRGAKRVYAGTRQALTHPNERVTPLILDVTDAAQIRSASERIESLDLLINNAGIALYDDLSDPAT